MKLKPIVFVQGKYAYNAQNTTQQMLLLNAMKITQNPKALAQMIGVKTVAEVYRVMDKIQMRQEYHAALVKLGMSFEYIAKGIKNEIENADKSSDRLNGLSMLLKSIGLDKYEETASTGGGWEETLLKISAAKEEQKNIIEYKVEEPKMPEHIKAAKDKANKEAKGLYE